MDFDQTKQSRRRQWCVDGTGALGWVIATSQAEQFSDNPLHKKSPFKRWLEKHSLLVPPTDFDQTKRSWRRLFCVDARLGYHHATG
jgi:hypothetical protein